MVKKRRVRFKAGTRTRTKLDDRIVEFLAAPKDMTKGIKLNGGKSKEILGFDKAFGLGGFDFTEGLNPELSSPFASTETKVTRKEIGFGRSFFEEEQDFLDDDPQAPEIIREDFEDPREEDLFDIEEPEDIVPVDFGVPNLFQSIKEVSLGKRIPKAERRRGTADSRLLRDEFEDRRAKMLATGGNPLTEQEQINFEQNRSFRGEKFA